MKPKQDEYVVSIQAKMYGEKVWLYLGSDLCDETSTRWRWGLSENYCYRFETVKDAIDTFHLVKDIIMDKSIYPNGTILFENTIGVRKRIYKLCASIGGQNDSKTTNNFKKSDKENRIRRETVRNTSREKRYVEASNRAQYKKHNKMSETKRR